MDAVLGEDYDAQTLVLPPDDEGDVVATLVSRRPSVPTTRAVLYLHGYNDYFFQRQLADFWDGLGYAFFALDLRKNGRSLQPWQTPSFVRHLHEYVPELDEAVRRIRGTGVRELVVMGHSTGGLTAALWLHHRRGRHDVAALVLNSPFLDLPGTSRDRFRASVAGVFGRVRPYAVVRQDAVDTYGRSLHRDLGGEWEYDLAWKPAGGLPLRAGWLAAARAGHRAVRRGLEVDVPVLVMASTRSVRARTWDDSALRADAVLDADRIAELAPRLGVDVTVVRVADGMHDLVLSTAPARELAYARMAGWVLDRLGTPAAEQPTAEQPAGPGR